MATSLMIVKDRKDHLLCRVPCDCADPGCDVSMEFTRDEHGLYTLDLESRMIACDYDSWSLPWYQAKYYTLRWRLKTAWKVLTKGYVETSSSFMLNNKNLEAFKEAVDLAKEKFDNEVHEKANRD